MIQTLSCFNSISGGSRISVRGMQQGSGGRAPSGVQGHSPWWEIRGGEKLSTFCDTTNNLILKFGGWGLNIIINS